MSEDHLRVATTKLAEVDEDGVNAWIEGGGPDKNKVTLVPFCLDYECDARINAAEEALTSRTEVENLFRKNTDEVVAALDTLTPEAIGTSLDTSLGWLVPMTILMNLPGIHAFPMPRRSTIYKHAGAIRTCISDRPVEGRTRLYQLPGCLSAVEAGPYMSLRIQTVVARV